MTDTYPAFDISPVPVPTPDAAPAELFRGIYGMPMFVTVPTSNLAASVDFRCRGLGFFDLFSVPGQITHLRRWAFQDVLLVPNEPPTEAPTLTVSFSWVLNQIDPIAAACAQLRPGCTIGPRQMPWNSVDRSAITGTSRPSAPTAATGSTRTPTSPASIGCSCTASLAYH